jgi:hypothetical protein
LAILAAGVNRRSKPANQGVKGVRYAINMTLAVNERGLACWPPDATMFGMTDSSHPNR